MKITVLGAGLVGKAMAIDLAANFDVTSVDLNAEVLDSLNKEHGISTLVADLYDSVKVKEVVADADLVIGAVPGFMGFATVKAVLEAKKNIVDISFFPEDMFELDAIAKQNGVMAITDIGVAPGMGNVILGYHNKQMKIENYECYVGGLPHVREWPYEYKAVFSPSDVIEEYVRPARYVANGNLVVREALSDAELMQFDGVGTLEAWNSDGLRSLIKTMPNIPDMIEKTLRYPGSIEYLRVLRETGFFSEEPVEINGHKIRPLDLTSKLLFPLWKLKKGESEFTVMRIIIEGEENGKKVRYQYDLHDDYNPDTDTTSMARTTGYTCTAVANLVAGGGFSRIGLNPPEYLGENPENFKYIVDYLAERGVIYKVSN